MSSTSEKRAQIEGFLGELGTPYRRITEDTWRSRFQGTQVELPFYIRLDPAGHVTMAVVPFVRSPRDADRARALYERLLQLNHSLLMAKFSIDDDLDVVLSVEYPLAELDASEFRDALDALLHYADRYYRDVKALA